MLYFTYKTIAALLTEILHQLQLSKQLWLGCKRLDYPADTAVPLRCYFVTCRAKVTKLQHHIYTGRQSSAGKHGWKVPGSNPTGVVVCRNSHCGWPIPKQQKFPDVSTTFFCHQQEQPMWAICNSGWQMTTEITLQFLRSYECQLKWTSSSMYWSATKGTFQNLYVSLIMPDFSSNPWPFPDFPD